MKKNDSTSSPMVESQLSFEVFHRAGDVSISPITGIDAPEHDTHALLPENFQCPLIHPPVRRSKEGRFYPGNLPNEFIVFPDFFSDPHCRTVAKVRMIKCMISDRMAFCGYASNDLGIFPRIRSHEEKHRLQVKTFENVEDVRSINRVRSIIEGKQYLTTFSQGCRDQLAIIEDKPSLGRHFQTGCRWGRPNRA